MHQISLCCDFFTAPFFCFSLNRVWCFLNCSQGQVELSSNHSAVCSIPISFLQLTPWHVCSSSVAERQPCCSGGELSPLTLGGLQTIVFSISLSAAILQDSLPSAPRFPRFPQMKPQYASPPTVVQLWMPEAELILVDVWRCWTRLICFLPIHTQAVQPSYSWAKLSRLVASLITKSTY